MKKNILISILLLNTSIFATHYSHNLETTVHKDKIPGFVVYIQGNTKVAKDFHGHYSFIYEPGKKYARIINVENAEDAFKRLEKLYSKQE